MPDSSQNGHSSTPHPLVRPPLGERASRTLTSDEASLADEASVLEAEAATDNGRTLDADSIEVAPRDPFEHSEAPLLGERLDEEREDEAALATYSGDDDGPPYDGGSDDNGGSSDWSDPNTPRDKEMGLIEHLGELRTRIMYCVVTVCLAMVLTWNKCTEISEWFARPIVQALKSSGNDRNQLISTDPTGFFTIYLQISMVSAIILTMPFLLLQVWRFIEPALTNKERKYTLVLVPFSSILFFLGAGMGYLLAPMFFKFFLEFQPTIVIANWDYLQSVLLLAKTLLVFGLAFQVPVIIIFLNKAGILSRNFLIEYWRHAVVVIFTIIAIVTPTWDPITMTACAIPPCLLYLLSIWLVKWL